VTNFGEQDLLRAFIRAAVAHPHYAEAAETRRFFGLPPASETALAAAATRAAVAAALSAAPLLHRLPQQWRVTLQGALEAAVAITGSISSGSSSTGSSSSTGGTNAVSSSSSSSGAVTHSSAAGAVQAGVSAELLPTSCDGTSTSTSNGRSGATSTSGGGTHQQRFDDIGAAAFAGQPSALRQVFYDGGPDNALQVSRSTPINSVSMHISVLFSCYSVYSCCRKCCSCCSLVLASSNAAICSNSLALAVTVHTLVRCSNNVAVACKTCQLTAAFIRLALFQKLSYDIDFANMMHCMLCCVVCTGARP
jgi:hypothetical protein